MTFFKSKKVFVGLVIIALILITVIGPYWYYHPTHYKYNDRFILGNRIAQIVERYGAFEKIFYRDESESEIHSAGYVVEPAKTGFLGTSYPKYYMITFNDGIAISVRIEIGGWGG